VPTPRGGGISILAVLFVGLGIIGYVKDSPVMYVLAAAAMALAIVSLRDDFCPVPAHLRFAAHSAAALAIIASLGSDLKSLAPSGAALILFVAASYLWLVGYTNAFNFMDGINGIAGGQAFITAVGTACIAASLLENVLHPAVLAAAGLGGAALGFLPHNFPRARMFMGDVGSAPVGFLLAALSLCIVVKAGDLWAAVPLLLIHCNYIFDTGITLVRRISRGERFYEAHKDHFYQRLVRAGKSHAFVTIVEMLLQLIALCVVLLYLGASSSIQALCATIVIFLWTVFFIYAETSFRGATARERPPSLPTTIGSRN
jgi:UDP-GlcNAc:undecaprenyl-phosphate/decaprenyl-phosphate GlcNAc-1-phosphate transferase